MSVCVYKSFQEIPGEVRLRLSYPGQANIFLSLDWFSLLFETSLRQTLTPRIYVVSDDQQASVGALFCGVSRSGVVRRLLSLTNFYTLEYGPSLAANGADRPAMTRELVDYIASERPRWHEIGLKLMNGDTPEMQSVSNDLCEAGFSTFPFFQYENWHIQTGGKTFQTYFAERGSQLRNTVMRKQKKLEKAHEFAIKVVRHESGELEGLLRDFIAVYNHSWKRPEPFPDFMPMLAAECARHRILRLGILYVDGKPAAGQFWINTPKKAIIYKLAYDEQYRDFGVGSILSKEMFRIAIDEDHVDEIDYGIGNEPYKKDWMSSMRKIEGVEAYNRKTLIGLLLLGVEAVKPSFHVILRRTSQLLKRWRVEQTASSRPPVIEAP